MTKKRPEYTKAKPHPRIRHSKPTGKTVPGYSYQNITYESGFIFDFWSCGMAMNKHNKDGKTIFAGAFPAGFLKRLKRAFVDCYPSDRKQILHVCAGSISSKEGIRLDIQKRFRPDIVANVEDFVDKNLVRKGQFKWVIADPPYNPPAAKDFYNLPMLSKQKMFKQMTLACKVGGYVGILDQYTQEGTPKNIKRVALIAVTSIPNRDVRLFTVWKKLSN